MSRHNTPTVSSPNTRLFPHLLRLKLNLSSFPILRLHWPPSLGKPLLWFTTSEFLLENQGDFPLAPPSFLPTEEPQPFSVTPSGPFLINRGGPGRARKPGPTSSPAKWLLSWRRDFWKMRILVHTQKTPLAARKTSDVSSCPDNGVLKNSLPSHYSFFSSIRWILSLTKTVTYLLYSLKENALPFKGMVMYVFTS